jgi:murein DD-endopeptidase MepM/ murein hydrolase activator NlpD
MDRGRPVAIRSRPVGTTFFEVMMRRAGFSLLLVPHENDTRGVRELRLPGTAFALLGVAAALLFVVFVALASTYGLAVVDRVRMNRLSRENQVLQDQLAQMRTAISELGDQMTVIARRDDAVRLAAELDPLPEELRRAGVGGSHLDFDRRVTMLSGETAASMKEAQQAINRLTREAKLEAESLLEVDDRLDAMDAFLRGYPSIFPIDQSKYRSRISSPFGYRPNPLYASETEFHEGHDIAAARGTPIIATADGVVAATENSFKGPTPNRYVLGNYVKIDHGNGYVTFYGHMERVDPRIHRNVKVKRGDVLGYVGNTGRVTGIHLHYEIQYSGKPVNPWFHYYNERVADITGNKLR